MKKPKERARIQAPVLALAVIALAFVLGWLRPLPLVVAPSVRVGGFVLAALGFLFGLGALVAFRRAPGPKQRGPRLVTSGLYRFSRNPVSLGFLFMLMGLPLNTGSVWGLALAPLMVVLFSWYVIGPEEAALTERFGDEYKAYVSRVRRWI